MKAEPTGPCNEGYFCNGTSKRPDQYPALEGSYAPKQSGAAISCPLGTFQTKARTGKCDDCTEGAYCDETGLSLACLLYTSPSPRDGLLSRMPSSA